MNSQIFQASYLAWRDWKSETLITLCSILALASMLAPILILLGLKTGVTSALRERLLKDPATLIITPKSDAGRYDKAFIESLRQLPGARFAIGRVRSTATDQTLENPAKKMHASIALEPAEPGEPILAEARIKAPADGQIPQIVLSLPAAKALGIASGEKLIAKLGRRTPEGKLESMPLAREVKAILPITAADRKIGFVPLSLLEDMEKYRDYIAAPKRGFEGAPPAAEQTYASFRLYAQNLDAVENLANALAAMRIETITRARDIAGIKNLEKAINQVILIISLAVGAGFAAFSLSSAEGAVRRKTRMLGMLRLLGFRRVPLICFPIVQTLLTSLCGFILSLGIYALVASAIDMAFAGKGELVCKLTIANALSAFLIVAALSTLAAARAAWQGASLEPSSVIREV